MDGPGDGGDPKKSHTGLIVGVTMAGVVVLLVVVGVYLWIKQKGQDRQLSEREQEPDDGLEWGTRASKGLFQGMEGSSYQELCVANGTYRGHVQNITNDRFITARQKGDNSGPHLRQNLVQSSGDIINPFRFGALS
jgi:hypothetical protein